MTAHSFVPVDASAHWSEMALCSKCGCRKTMSSAGVRLHSAPFTGVQLRTVSEDCDEELVYRVMQS